jgi:hypothetical protein
MVLFWHLAGRLLASGSTPFSSSRCTTAGDLQFAASFMKKSAGVATCGKNAFIVGRNAYLCVKLSPLLHYFIDSKRRRMV